MKTFFPGIVRDSTNIKSLELERHISWKQCRVEHSINWGNYLDYSYTTISSH